MKRNRETLKKYKFLIKICFIIIKIFPKFIRKGILNFNRRNSSKFAMLLNFILVKSLCKSCGENVAIFSNVYLLNLENLTIGNNVSIHPMTYIDAKGGILIGNDVSIAHSTTILSSEHIYDKFDVPIKDQGVSLKKTVINNNVWIGAGVRILAGSVIGEGCIVGSSAVVKGRTDENFIYAGIPAKKMKKRVGEF
ncbi:acyltransferase [Clostridium perfringens]|nr:acyltransferase [Clostridium perfringens]